MRGERPALAPGHRPPGEPFKSCQPVVRARAARVEDGAAGQAAPQHQLPRISRTVPASLVTKLQDPGNSEFLRVLLEAGDLVYVW